MTSSEAAVAAAAESAVQDDDASQARKIVVTEQLIAAYGFDAEVVEKAMEEVGADVSAAVKYIFDNGLGTDPGGAVQLKADCPHVKNHVKITQLDLPEKLKNAECSFVAEHDDDNDDDPQQQQNGNNNNNCPPGENWLCLECGKVYCSRYVNAHGVGHWEETKSGEDMEGHCIAASLADLSVWCHECDCYLQDPLLDPILQKLEHLKFQEASEQEPLKKKARSNPPSEDEDSDE